MGNQQEKKNPKNKIKVSKTFKEKKKNNEDIGEKNAISEINNSCFNDEIDEALRKRSKSFWIQSTKNETFINDISKQINENLKQIQNRFNESNILTEDFLNRSNCYFYPNKIETDDINEVSKINLPLKDHKISSFHKKGLNVKINDENIKNINNNINNVNDIIDNININKEIQDKENISKINNNEKDEDFEDYEKRLNRWKLRRRNTFQQRLNRNIIDNDPNYCLVFEKINIFNSILIMMNNISYINKYLSEIKEDEIINLEKNEKNSLSCILYYINKYLWDYNYKSKVSENDLLIKYKNFVEFYSNSAKDTFNPDKFFYETQNIEIVTNFIYEQINSELSHLLKDKKINFNGDDKLTKFLNNFFQKNKSVISDNYIGFYQKNKICISCQRKAQLYGMNSNIEINYFPFNLITFKINEIFNFYLNYKCPINLDKCFNYVFCQKNKSSYNSFCNYCYIYTIKNESFSILSLPKILTIVLSNNDEKYNFILQDELNLIQYINYPSNAIYKLISVLCINTYNQKFICYCNNPNNGLWYSFSDGRIDNDVKIDINSKPLLLIYQIKESMDNKYKSIKRDDINKISLNIKFSNGMEQLKLNFNKNNTFEKVIKQILTHKNLKKEKLSLLIDGKKVNETQKLSEVLNSYDNNVLAIVSD